MRIFVYGSLRTKQGNSHWMTNAQLLGNYNIENYQLYSLGHYPGAFRGTEQYRVKFIVLIMPRLPNLMPCAPGAVNMHVSWSRLRMGVHGCTCTSVLSMD